MIESSHVLNEVSDYALDLLPIRERQRVEEHVAGCSKCRQAMQHENQIGLAVRTTLHHITQPDNKQLARLMPPIPQRRLSPWGLISQKQVAPVVLLLLLMIGSWGLWQSNQHLFGNNPPPTFLAATATMTDVPTATIEETQTSWEGEPTLTAEPLTLNQSEIYATPVPNPTPMAAVHPLITSN